MLEVRGSECDRRTIETGPRVVPALDVPNVGSLEQMLNSLGVECPFVLNFRLRARD